MFDSAKGLKKLYLSMYRTSKENTYKHYRRTHRRDTDTEILPVNPLISIVVPVYNADENVLAECVNSVRAQIYKNWELIMIDDHSPKTECVAALHKYDNDPKIITGYHDKNCQIAKTTNDCIALAHGEYIAFMDCDDVIESDALYLMVKKAVNENCDVVYTDDDHMSFDGKKFSYPTLKPDWAPDTLMSLMYTGHFSMYRKSIIDEIGGLGEGVDGSQDYDLTLRFTEKTDRIGHVPYVLYHWRMGENSTAGNPEAKLYAYKAAYEAKKRRIERLNLPAKLDYLDKYYQTRVIYIPDPGVKITIEDIAKIRAGESYGAAVNRIFKSSTADVVLVYDSTIINSGTEIESIKSTLAGMALRKHAGLVSPLIMYKNYVSEAGIGYLPSKRAFGRLDNGNGSVRELNFISGDVCACSSVCFAMRRSVFLEAGDFDESLSDYGTVIEYSLRLLEKGYFNILRTDAEISANKMEKQNVISKGETEKILSMHPHFKKDPFYSDVYCDFRHNISDTVLEHVYRALVKVTGRTKQ